MPKLQAAVIGCGSIAHAAHLPAYRDNQEVEVRYCCDIIPERADKAAKQYGGKAVYDYHEILNDPELHIVSVCTHNDHHASISIDFMRAGKDVLCEKPAAGKLAEALQMQQAASETGRLLSIGVVNRFGLYNNLVKTLIDRGELGEVYHAYISFRAHRSIPGIGGDFTSKAVSGGGVLIDWGVHYIDLALYCLGEPQPLTASGEAFCKLGCRDDYTFLSMWASDSASDQPFDVEDSVTALVRTTGPTLTVHGAWAQNIKHGETFIDFMGTKGGIRLKYGGEFTLFSSQDGALTERHYELADGGHSYKNEINSFVESVRSRVPNQANINNAVRTSQIMDAIYRSSELHREVTI